MKNYVFHARAEGRGQRAQFVILKSEPSNFTCSRPGAICFQEKSSVC